MSRGETAFVVAKKKLQVFVSSTYQDLRAERQAAVEAILTAGHIPAGMELFAAGDQSQMNVIKRWIDESDVFLLVLGGRYGSIEPESGKSYIHLEYDYAVARGKPFFAVVIEDDHLESRVRSIGSSVLEKENPAKLKDFRKQVLGRLVKFWSDPRDIRLAIYETLADFGRRDDLAGWVPGSQGINAGRIAEEIARLAKENAELREQIQAGAGKVTYNGFTFEEMFDMLDREPLDLSSVDAADSKVQESIVSLLDEGSLGDVNCSLIHGLWVVRDDIIPRMSAYNYRSNVWRLLHRLEYYGLVREIPSHNSYGNGKEFEITPDGQRFVLRLRAENRDIDD